MDSPAIAKNTNLDGICADFTSSGRTGPPRPNQHCSYSYILHPNLMCWKQTKHACMHTSWIPIKSQPIRSPPSVKMQGTEDQHSVRVQGECLAFQRGGKQLYPFLILMTKLLLDLVCLEIMAPNPLKFMVFLAPLLPLLLQVSLTFIFLNLAFMWKLS